MRYHPAQRNIVWTVLFSLFTILSLTACGDANNVTGPPPPVPLSPDAKLSSLTVNPGPLPKFSSDVLIYTVDLATTVTSVTVTARAQNAGATVNINGQPTTSRSVGLGAPGSSTLIQIVVTAVSGNQNTYLVTVNRAPPGGNNNLQSLSVTPGTLSPPFNASTTNYTVDVATSLTGVTVTARAQDAGASVNINGQLTTSRSVTIGAPGSSTPIPIVVTAPNGTQKTYLVTVNRAAPGGNNNLQSLTVTPGTLSPPFNASTTNYTVGVATTVPSVAVTARPQDAGATVSINGQVTTNLSVPLGAAGSNTPISLVVTAPNGTQKTYLVTVNRAAPGGNNNLQSLSVTPGTLTPTFAPDKRRYTVNVVSTVDSVVVAAQPQDAGATISINDQPTTTGLSVPLGVAGTTTQIDIDVMAPNGSQRTYTVVVSRAAFIPSGNNNLSSLVVSAGALVPAFDASILNYDVAVPNTTADTIVTATVEDSTAALAINGSPATSGVPSASIPIPPSISIVVTAENLTTKTYTITITVVP
jgi:Cadherin-like beta sandwich domain